MIMNRTALARPPAQDQTLEVPRLVHQVSGIAIFGEQDIRLDFRRFGLQVRDKTAQLRQAKFFGRMFELFNGCNQVHAFNLRSLSMNNQGGRPPRIRFVAWNIEKGKRWSLLQACLDCEAIRTADVLCLNEVDDGMARSGNRRIACEIAERLGMRMVFGPTFRELTKGIGDELCAPGENTTAVQGNATLSRLSIIDSQNLALPMCHDPSQGAEKREGGRHALIVRLDCGNGRTLTVANAHLEVFTTTRCRSRQMRFLLQHLDPGPAVVAGDFNTNTFQRGSFVHTFRSLLCLLCLDARARVTAPWRYEPLFQDLRNTGFLWERFNDSVPTCSVDLSELQDRAYVPAAIRNRILERCRILPLRLDFLACRGLHALSAGRTVTELPCRPSDHLPITCDIWFDNMGT